MNVEHQNIFPKSVHRFVKNPPFSVQNGDNRNPCEQTLSPPGVAAVLLALQEKAPRAAEPEPGPPHTPLGTVLQ